MNGSSVSTDSDLHALNGPVLFVADARNRLERRFLEEWIEAPAGTAPGGSDRFVLSIEEGKSFLSLDELTGKLNGPDETNVVPIRVLWTTPAANTNKPLGLRHLLLGDPRRPGLARAYLTMLRNGQRAQCLVGEAATLGELKRNFSRYEAPEEGDSPQEFAKYVVRQAGLTLELAERRLRGGRYKVPHFVAESLNGSPGFRTAVTELAGDLKRPANDMFRDARGYMKELIAVPNAFFIDLRARFEEVVLSLGYEKKIVYRHADLEKVRRIVRDHPAVLLWTHKSHMDGAALSSVMYKNDFPIPHMFGGINMSFAGLGFLLRRSGAIFIRRTFQDNPLYKLVLRHYIGYLMEKRFPMTWAFEGTRSRAGKLMPPRYGLLKYVIDAARTTGTRNLHIIPVSISYDLIRDVEDYATEQAGRKKQPESLKWFIGYVSSLRRPMGRIYMNFGDPVILQRAPAEDDQLAIPKIAFDVAVQANNVTPVTLPSLACLCLLRASPRALTVEELQADIIAFANWIIARNIMVTSDFNPDRLANVQTLANAMVDSGMLVRYDQGSGTVYGIESERQPVASYYRNTIIHYFVNKAILELALVKASDAPVADAAPAFWRETERLRDYFKFEFFYPPSERFREELEEELRRCAGDWESKLEAGGEELSSIMQCMQPWVAHATLLTYVEAYTVILDLIARLGEGEGLEEKDCVALALKEGRQAYLQRRITSEASIGKLLFQNGFKLAENLGMTAGVGDGIVERRVRLLREFQELSRRLEKIAYIARNP